MGANQDVMASEWKVPTGKKARVTYTNLAMWHDKYVIPISVANRAIPLFVGAMNNFEFHMHTAQCPSWPMGTLPPHVIESFWVMLNRSADAGRLMGRNIDTIHIASVFDSAIQSRLYEHFQQPTVNGAPQGWALESLSSCDKLALKQRLAELHPALMDVDAVLVQYVDLLGHLWSAALAFFEIARQPYDASLEAEFAQRWGVVKAAGAALRAMFTSGQIPAGVLLP